LRSISVEAGYLKNVPGSVLYRLGDTWVLATASIEEEVPKFLRDSKEGWLTAEYAMMPASTRPRSPRTATPRGQGRLAEIQRMIGRSLRAIVDLKLLGNNTVILDCEVLQADGGTRTASVNASFIALKLLINHCLKTGMLQSDPVHDEIGAISVGIVQDRILVDLDYSEDSIAQVDLNLVMTRKKRIVEIQGSAEGGPFDIKRLDEMVDEGWKGLVHIFEVADDILRRTQYDINL
jgi:ribonuclease PH